MSTLTVHQAVREQYGGIEQRELRIDLESARSDMSAGSCTSWVPEGLGAGARGPPAEALTDGR